MPVPLTMFTPPAAVVAVMTRLVSAPRADSPMAIPAEAVAITSSDRTSRRLSALPMAPALAFRMTLS